MQSRDLSRDQLKRLYDQRIADILNNSPLLFDSCSFDAGLWLLHAEAKSKPRFHARIPVSYLKPAKTVIMGYFPGGSIANIVQ